ncbi:MAG: methyl-accepting chemotaxis protein, partial [Pseudomonas sp.]|nr:methyl-accepting chemotaxis protein [Pseudomonas sp.]
MNWFYNAKLSTKLFIAFALCALITLAVGVIGGRGIESISASLKAVFSNNLVSVSRTNETKNNFISQNRDLYRYLSAAAANAPQTLKDEILVSMRENRAAAEKAYAQYRALPLADDERAAGDQMDRDWPAYQALLDRIMARIDAGDIPAARALITTEMHQSYRQVMDELNVMVKSNGRQANEAALEGTKTEASARLNLYVGVGLGFLAAFILGMFISRTISR